MSKRLGESLGHGSVPRVVLRRPWASNVGIYQAPDMHSDIMVMIGQMRSRDHLAHAVCRNVLSNHL